VRHNGTDAGLKDGAGVTIEHAARVRGLGLSGGTSLVSTLQREHKRKSRSGPVAIPKKALRADIQGLRAFAVVAVILAHVSGWPSGGFVGVDIFFVISGFLITGMLLGQYEKTGTISFIKFYKSRARRLLPASILVIAATVAFSNLLLPKTRSDPVTVDAVWSLLFAGNWRFATAGTDYFNEGTPPSPLQHFWSLGVEEQFYFVWPWLMLGLFVAVAKVLGHRRAGRKAAGIAISLIIVASLLWALRETASEPNWAYFSTCSRAWELGIGALIAVLAPIIRMPGLARTALAWAGLAGMVLAVFLVSDDAAFPAPWALLPVLAAAAVIIAGTNGEAKGLWPLTNRVSGYIGDISYSLYLWHWPVVVLLLAFLPAGSVMYVISAILASLLLSVASFYLVEDPIRQGKASALRQMPKDRLKIVGVGVLTVFTIAVSAAALLRTPEVPGTFTPTPVAGSSAVAEPTESAADCLGASFLDPAKSCTPDALPGALQPSVDSFADDTGGAYACWRNEGEPSDVCSIGSTADDAKRVMLIGDSHAASLRPAIEDLAEENNWKVDIYAGVGCQWMAMTDSYDCADTIAEANAAMLEGEPYDAIITTGARGKAGSDSTSVVGQMVEAWQPVADRGTKILAIADVPSVDPEALACVTRFGFNVRENDCGTPADVAAEIPDPIIEAASSVPGASLIDMSEYFCQGDTCPSVIGDTIVYRDAAAHMTATYARTIAPYLNAKLLAAMGS
jgi:peptidoglycan/LPS O-acetylase OafA/YrhL